MKIRAFILTLFLIASILSPLSFHCDNSSNEKFPSIAAIDVCHGSAPSLSVNSETPVIYEYQSIQPSLWFTGLYESISPASNPFLIVFQKEKPPRV